MLGDISVLSSSVLSRTNLFVMTCIASGIGTLLNRLLTSKLTSMLEVGILMVFSAQENPAASPVSCFCMISTAIHLTVICIVL